MGGVPQLQRVYSIYFFLLNDFVILPLSFFAAFFLYKKMPLGNVFRVLFFIPSIISVVVLTMLFSFMFDSSIGVVDSLLRAIGLERVIPDLVGDLLGCVEIDVQKRDLRPARGKRTRELPADDAPSARDRNDLFAQIYFKGYFHDLPPVLFDRFKQSVQVCRAERAVV